MGGASDEPHDNDGVPDASDVTEAASGADEPTSGTDAAAEVIGIEELTAGLLRLHAERMQVVAREERTRDQFTALHPEVAVTAVGALPGDVHDLDGLRAIGDRLAGGSAPAPAGAA